MKNSAKYIADRIRLMIATKQFQVGELLPSTRELGRQLEVSFHTVRKAYSSLQDEGLIRSEQGRGFVVNRQNTSFDKSERLELGAEKMQVLLEELIGYGLDESEIETIFAERISFLEWPDKIQSCAAIDETTEMARLLSQTIRKQVGVKSDVLSSSEIEKMIHYDAVFVPVHLIYQVRAFSESVRIMPVVYHYDTDLLLSIVERAAIETIGLVTAEEGSISGIINHLKQMIRFTGSFVAGATYGRSLPLFVKNADLILYTPACAKLVEAKIPEKSRLQLDYIIAEKSANRIRAELWDQ
ncbi:MAG: GntR family transcriptional regulator [Balneolaceae bacterium]